MKKSVYILSFLISLPFLSACDSSDDLVGIFTGKSWVLTDILQNNTSYFNWAYGEDATEEEKDASKDLLRTEGNYTLSFSGSLIDETISGMYSGRIVNASIPAETRWSANQKKEFKSDKFTANESDPLAKEFVEGLNNAYKYGGDYNNLYIYYKIGGAGKERMLLFRQVKK